jgi:hypothetical protein
VLVVPVTEVAPLTPDTPLAPVVPVVPVTPVTAVTPVAPGAPVGHAGVQFLFWRQQLHSQRHPQEQHLPKLIIHHTPILFTMGLPYIIFKSAQKCTPCVSGRHVIARL